MTLINSNPTVIEAAGYMHGVYIKTGTVAALTYLHQDQKEAFDLKGTIILRQLYMEVVTALGNVATTLKFTYTMTDPVLAVKDLNAAAAAMNSAPRGYRACWLGGAVATAGGVTVATGCCSDLVNDKTGMILGCLDGVGTIGYVTAGADATQGSVFFAAVYQPMGDGSLSAKF